MKKIAAFFLMLMLITVAGICASAADFNVAKLYLPDAQSYEPYEAQINMVGGNEGYTFEYVSGLPSGLSIDSSGKVSGTPAGAGTYMSIIVNISHTDGTSETKSFMMDVTPIPIKIKVTGGNVAYDGEQHTATVECFDYEDNPINLDLVIRYGANRLSGAVDAGSYYISVYAPLGYTIISRTGDENLVVTPITGATISLDDITVDYGQSYTPNVTVNPSAAGYAVQYNVGGVYTSTKPTGAGTYLMRAHTTNPNYEEAYATATLTIIGTTVDFTVADTTKEYTGSILKPTITTDSGLKEGEGYTVTYTDSENNVVDPVNAGTYTINIALTDKQAYTMGTVNTETFTITPKQVKFTARINGSSSAEYTGAAQTPVVTVTPEGFTAYTLTYKKQNEDAPSDIKDVGVYDIVITLTDSKNYTISEESDKTITITAKQVNISIGNKTATYNENPHGVSDLNITATPATEGAYTVKFRKIGESGEGAISVTDAGTYDILFTPADGYNLTGDTTNQQFVISKRDIHFTVSPATHEYDSNTVTPTVTPDLSGFSAYTYKIEKDSVEVSEIQDAGTYNIVVNLTDNDNNNAVMTNNSIVITPANVTFTVTNNAANYDGSAHKATINTDLSLTEGTDYEVKYVKEGVKTDDATGVGEYTIEITMKNPNYTTAYTPQTMTVNGVAVTFTVTNNIANYDGSAHKATISSDPSLTEGTDYEIKYVKDGIETDDVTNAGEYDIKVTILDSNYSLAAAVTDKMTVTPKTINFTVGDNTYSYDGAYHQATITPSETVPEGTYSVKYDNGTAQSDSVKDSGTYTIEITSENGNYVIGTISDSTLTITSTVKFSVGNSPAAMIFADTAHAEDTEENIKWRADALESFITNNKFVTGFVPVVTGVSEETLKSINYTSINSLATNAVDGDKNTLIVKSIPAEDIAANRLTADPGLMVDGEKVYGTLSAVGGYEGLYKLTYTHDETTYERYVLVVPTKIGDTTGNKYVNAVDANKLDKLNRAPANVTEARIWDVNKDNVLDAQDAAAIRNRFASKLIPYYPWVQ